jgi:hypothetical protein
MNDNGHKDLLNKTFNPYTFTNIKTNYDCHATIIHKLQEWVIKRTNNKEAVLNHDFLLQIEYYRKHYRTFLSYSLLLYTYQKMILRKHIESHPRMWKLLSKRKKERHHTLYIDTEKDGSKQVTRFLETHTTVKNVILIVRVKRRLSVRFVKDLIYSFNKKDINWKSGENKEEVLKHLNDEWCFNRCASVKVVEFIVEPYSFLNSSDVESYIKLGVTGIQLTSDMQMSQEQIKITEHLAKKNGLKFKMKISINKMGTSHIVDLYCIDEYITKISRRADEIVIGIQNETALSMLEKWHNSPKYVPYAKEEETTTIFTVLKYALLAGSSWMLMRVEYDSQYEMITTEEIDIPSLLVQEIDELGMNVKNIERRIQAAIEIKIPEFLNFFILKQSYNLGTDFFISNQSKDCKKLSGFIRLYVPNDGNLGIIREIKARDSFALTKMLEIAENISKQCNSKGIAIRRTNRNILVYNGFEMEQHMYVKRFGILTRLYYMLPGLGNLFSNHSLPMNQPV